MEKLWENTRFWKKELGVLGFDIGGRATPASETPITPIIIGDGKLTMDFSRELFKEGVLGTGIAFPTVPEGKARIRTIMTATHTKEELSQALEVLGRVGKRIGIFGQLMNFQPNFARTDRRGRLFPQNKALPFILRGRRCSRPQLSPQLSP
jgi:glycine C-acetyltransferase